MKQTDEETLAMLCKRLASAIKVEFAAERRHNSSPSKYTLRLYAAASEQTNAIYRDIATIEKRIAA